MAEGGYQVGELAKFLVSDDPVGEDITINELDYEKSLAQTKEKRDKGGINAQAAYAYLQFADMTDAERELYRQALLRYCELDTMAMVMIWEYWGKEIGK